MSNINLQKWLHEDEFEALESSREEFPDSEMTEELEHMWENIAKLRRQNEKLREGLEFYATTSNFGQEIINTPEVGPNGEQWVRFGSKAQQILEEVDNGKDSRRF